MKSSQKKALLKSMFRKKITVRRKMAVTTCQSLIPANTLDAGDGAVRGLPFVIWRGSSEDACRIQTRYRPKDTACNCWGTSGSKNSRTQSRAQGFHPFRKARTRVY